jgi:hypothetical protein
MLNEFLDSSQRLLHNKTEKERSEILNLAQTLQSQWKVFIFQTTTTTTTFYLYILKNTQTTTMEVQKRKEKKKHV